MTFFNRLLRRLLPAVRKSGAGWQDPERANGAAPSETHPTSGRNPSQGGHFAEVALASDELEALPAEGVQCHAAEADSAHLRRHPAELELTVSELTIWPDSRDRAKILISEASFDEAEKLLLQAAERFPNESAVYHDLARLAERRAEWLKSEYWWRRHIALVPGAPQAYPALGAAIRLQNRIAEAEEFLLESHARLPNEPDILVEYAKVAEQIRDWDEAEQRFAAVIKRFPAHWIGFEGRATALRELSRFDEAEKLLLHAADQHPGEIPIWRGLALLAERRSDWAAAEQWWRYYVALVPNQAGGHSALAAAIRNQGRIADTEGVLVNALDRLPHVPALFEEHARLAETTKDWEEAGRRWNRFREQFPNHCAGYLGCARVLRAQDNLADAEALLREAAALFPSQSSVLNDLARVAEERSDWEAAERTWRACVAVAPDAWWGCVALAEVLHRQGKSSEADAVLVDAQARFPFAAPAFHTHARLAAADKQWDRAALLWDAFRARFPNDWGGYCGGAATLRELGRTDEAESLLRQAVEKFPQVAGPLHDLARLAEQRSDWAAAGQLWRRYRALFPDAQWAQAALEHALRRQGRAAEVDEGSGHTKPTSSADEATRAPGAGAENTAREWEEAKRRSASRTQRRSRSVLAPRRIVFVGNCQAAQLALALERFGDPERGDSVSFTAAYTDAGESDRRRIAEADVVALQITNAEQAIGGITTQGKVVLFPNIAAAWIWPYDTNEKHPLDNTKGDELRLFPPQASDGFLNSAIRHCTPVREAIDSYLATDVARVRTLDRRFELHLESQRARDLKSGANFADYIDAHFRSQTLFRTTGHPRGELTTRLIDLVFPRLDADPANVVTTSDGPHVQVDLPVHPAVAEHFGMNWVTTETRYQHHYFGRFTFVEWCERYMRFAGGTIKPTET